MNCHENDMPYYQFKPKETSIFRFENWIVTHEEVVLHRIILLIVKFLWLIKPFLIKARKYASYILQRQLSTISNLNEWILDSLKFFSK